MELIPYRCGTCSYIHNFFNIFQIKKFRGWGRKRTGRFAAWCYRTFGGQLILLEDGFIRSIGLGIEGSPLFSIVEDDVGIYYDATTPSRLENILNTYDFLADDNLMGTAREAIGLIRKHRISKYNNASDVPEGYFGDEKGEGDGSRIKSGMTSEESGMTGRVLIIAQTAGDASLIYGLGDTYTTDQMIDTAITENPDAKIYLKIHPDVLTGKKRSDIDIDRAREKCIIIDQNFNPISLLEYFDVVYTKTSQMGFEALIMGKKCVCFGMPFYAGWGITDDRISCERRKRSLGADKIFAAAYILYTRYNNPYAKRSSDIIDTIYEIVRQRHIQQNRPINRKEF